MAYVTPLVSPVMVVPGASVTPGVHSIHVELEDWRYHTLSSTPEAVDGLAHVTLTEADPGVRRSAVAGGGAVIEVAAGDSLEHPIRLQALMVMAYEVDPASPPSV